LKKIIRDVTAKVSNDEDDDLEMEDGREVGFSECFDMIAILTLFRDDDTLTTTWRLCTHLSNPRIASMFLLLSRTVKDSTAVCYQT
jgi:hypothetical protein